MNFSRTNDLPASALVAILSGDSNSEQIAEANTTMRKEKLLELQQYLLEQAYLYSPVSDTSGWAFGWTLQDFYPNTALSESIFWAKVWLKP